MDTFFFPKRKYSHIVFIVIQGTFGTVFEKSNLNMHYYINNHLSSHVSKIGSEDTLCIVYLTRLAQKLGENVVL